MSALATAAGPVARTDYELIQGAWMSVAGRREARLLVAGHRFAVEFADGDIYMGELALDPPGELAMYIEAGPERHVGTAALCLYQIDGGVLRWCAGPPGSGRRPAAFADVDDARALSLVFRRAGRR